MFLYSLLSSWPSHLYISSSTEKVIYLYDSQRVCLLLEAIYWILSDASYQTSSVRWYNIQYTVAIHSIKTDFQRRICITPYSTVYDYPVNRYHLNVATRINILSLKHNRSVFSAHFNIHYPADITDTTVDSDIEWRGKLGNSAKTPCFATSSLQRFHCLRVVADCKTGNFFVYLSYHKSTRQMKLSHARRDRCRHILCRRGLMKNGEWRSGSNSIQGAGIKKPGCRYWVLCRLRSSIGTRRWRQSGFSLLP